MTTSPKWQGTAEMIRRTHTVRGREAAGLYSIEGTRLVERALRAGVIPETILMSEAFHAEAGDRAAQLREDLSVHGVPVYIAPNTVMGNLTEGRDLGAVLGLVRLPEESTLREIIGRTHPQPALFLAGVDILDPGNAGALIRTAHASGATAFLAVGTTDPFHPRATRISRGSIFRLPVVHYASAESLMTALSEFSIRSIATATDGVRLPDLPVVNGPTAVLMGNEGEGLPPEILRAVDTVVTIPMPPGVDSFAVNAAAAVVLYELQRSLRYSPAQAEGGPS